MSRLEIRLFGVMHVSLNGQPVTTFESNKVRALLAYLTTERGPHPREQLAELFWPERAEGSARNNLRHALAILRQTIQDRSAEPPGLLITGQTIQFNPDADAWVDVTVFAAGADGDIAKMEAQVALYNGPFLADITISGSAPLEDWLQLKREQFEEQVANRLRCLAEHYEEQGPFEAGLEHARRWLEFTPWQEDAHRQLMRLLALDGRRSEALLQYEACRRALADELDVEPDDETDQLVAQIRAGSFPGKTPWRRQSIRGYELRRQIGAGGFGEVYRAYQPALDRDVAIKVILPQFANLPEFIQRFETEAQLIARLEHPHIVPLYDYWREPGRAFLVMRWLRGGNLAHSLRAGAWSIPAATQLLAQIAGALNVAHQQGIVHRDVKPANILLDEECNAYLSDFGIAKGPLQTASQTYGYSSDGSPDYSSPEQAQKQPLSPLSDLFSLGLVMCEVLTGAHPFAELSPNEQISRRLAGSLPRIIARRPELPEALQQVLERATAADPAARFPDVQSFAVAFREAVTPATATLFPTPDWALTEPVNPYKGLRAFDEADAPDFFGRDALVTELLTRLDHRFLAVIGPSGCGKSSVVKAGMLPAIREGELPGADQWRIVKMFPGDHPLDELEIGLLRVAVSRPADLAEQLRRDERGLLRAVRLIVPEEEPAALQPPELLLVIDQFEELYTHTVDRSEREHLLDLLYCAVTATRSPVRVIITLRADFYDRPLLHPSFSRLLQNHTAVVLPLTVAELAQAVEEPAKRAGVHFEPGLAATIVADVTEQPGALPMLQYALLELFEQREGRLLTDAAYRAMGGVAGALGRRAEAIHATLDANQQPAARQIFLRLVSPGEAAGDSGATPDTRRRVRLSELTALGAAQQADGDRQPDSAPPNPIPEVIELFGQHRLLTFDRDPATREPTVEVSHEALLYEWARLRQWLEETRDDLRLQRILAGAAAEWLGSGQSAGFLLRGSRLDQFAEWSQTSDLVLTDTEQAYLDASLGARAVRQTEDALRVEHEQGLERRSRRFLRTLAAVFAVAAVVALALSYFALRQRRSALEAFSLSLGANAQRALDEQDTVTALALALAANEIDDPPAEAQRVLMNAAYAPGPRQRYQVEELFPGVTGPATALAASPTSDTILLGLADGSIIVWRPQTGEEIFRLQGHTGAVNDIAISADGLRAVSGGDDAQVIVWDLETGQALHRLTGHSGAVLTVDISPDGSRILSGGIGGDFVENPGELFLWDAESGAEFRRFEDIPKAVMAAAFAQEGRVVLAGSGDPEVVTSSGGEGPSGALVYQHIWDAESGQPLDTLAGLESDILSLAVSPDGRSALIGSFYDGTVVHWDLLTGEPIRTLAAHDDAVTNVAFAADGTRALSGSADRQLILWDLNSGEAVNRFAAHDDEILAAALSADGRYAFSSARDGSLIVWDLFDGMEQRRCLGHGDQVYDVAFSPDGSRILSSSGSAELTRDAFDATLRLWDPATCEQLLVINLPGPVILQAAFAPDGRHALATGTDGVVKVVDLESGAIEARVAHGPWQAGADHEGSQRLMIPSLDVSQEYQLALTGSVNGMMLLWNLDDAFIRDPAALQPPLRFGVEMTGETGAPWAVAISPDGRTALSDAGPGGTIWWDLATGTELGRFASSDPTARGGTSGIAFLPDGRSAISILGNGQIIQWDLESGDERSLGRHDGIRGRVEVSPDGRFALTSGWNGELAYWDLETGEALRRFGRPGITFDIDMSRNGRYALTASSDRSVTLWDLSLLPATNLLDWISANRYVRKLSCDEQVQYGIASSCP